MISQLGLVRMGDLFREESPQVLTLAVTTTTTTLKNGSQVTHTTKVIPTDQRDDGAVGGIDDGVKNSVPTQVPVSQVERIINKKESVTGTKPKKKSMSTQIRTTTRWN